jgi:hypothetical protein
MPNKKPEETLEQPKYSRSLGIALGATEIVFLLGLCLLAASLVLVFGFAIAGVVIGAVLVVTSWLMQFAG